MKNKNFTAIDFETANQYRTSACQIGIVLVENGKIKKEFVSYIKPEPNYFNSKFTKNIHGIDASTVIDAPTFPELWPTIASYIENAALLVAHNIGFDKSVLANCLEYHEIKAKIPETYCTLNKSKQQLANLENHQLSTVCDYFGIALNHHEALSDARATAKIALKLGLK